MKNIKLSLLGCLVYATILFTACNSDGSVKEVNSINPGKDSSTAAGIASIPKADTAFMFKAADAGMTEVKLGKYAMNNSQNAQIKDFGSMMVTDHIKAGDELKALATAEGVNLPDTLTSEHQDMIKKMIKKTGKDFDKSYINMMVNDHNKVIDAFQDEIKSGKDSTIVAFASKTLPVLQKHLDAAKTAQQSLSNNP